MKQLFAALLISAVLVSPASAARFSDVPSDHWATSYIDMLVMKGVFSGYPDGTFAPNNALTRAATVKVVLKSLNKPIPQVAESGFGDVESDNPFVDYIAAAKNLGVVNGYSDGTFAPNKEVTRAEFVKIFLSAANLVLANPGSNSDFVDVPASNVFVDYIRSAKRLGFLNGYSDGTFKPDRSVSRAEASKIIANYLISQDSESVAIDNSADELEMVDIINEVRKSYDLPELLVDKSLSEVARAHSQDLLDNGRKTDHYGSDGSDPFDRLKTANIAYVNAAENVGWGTYHTRTISEVMQAINEAMINEPENEHNHRANILSTFFDFSHIGIGIAVDDETKQIIITELFIRK